MTSAPGAPERIVLDTNVLASALAFGGNPRLILEHGKRGTFSIFLSEFILEELRGVLASKKFRWENERIDRALDTLRAFAKIVEPSMRVQAIESDVQDNRILECALEARAAVLVTGNMAHIRPLGSFQGIRILTPREFLDTYFPSL